VAVGAGARTLAATAADAVVPTLRSRDEVEASQAASRAVRRGLKPLFQGNVNFVRTAIRSYSIAKSIFLHQ
jgi:hypothetical protein